MPDFNACYGEYLRDESRQTGWAESISFPKTEEQVREAICEVSSQNGTITVQGARTGLSASAVPNGGHILNLSRMNKILGARYDENSGDFFLTVQPGVLLSQIRKALAQKSFITGEWDQPSKDALDHIKPGEWFFLPRSDRDVRVRRRHGRVQRFRRAHVFLRPDKKIYREDPPPAKRRRRFKLTARTAACKRTGLPARNRKRTRNRRKTARYFCPGLSKARRAIL